MNMPSPQKPAGIFSLVLLSILTLPLIAIAGPGEEANAIIDRWSAAYSANDPEAVTKNYRPDAILLGTESPVLSQGTDAIRAYFSNLKGSGNKNAIGERYTMVLNDNANSYWLLRLYPYEKRSVCTRTVAVHYASH